MVFKFMFTQFNTHGIESYHNASRYKLEKEEDLQTAEHAHCVQNTPSLGTMYPCVVTLIMYLYHFSKHTQKANVLCTLKYGIEFGSRAPLGETAATAGSHALCS